MTREINKIEQKIRVAIRKECNNNRKKIWI
jgi:hypothetical protein